jgi:hypothetical protein
MRAPAALDRWMQRYGWRFVLVAMVVAAVVRAWQMWRQPVLSW